MDDAWVCGACKSINRARERRCYSCHGERDEAVASGGAERRTMEAVANRTVRDFLPTWPLAILSGVLLVVVAGLGIMILLRSAQEFPALRDAFVVAVSSGGAGIDTGAFATQSAETAFLGLLRTGLLFLALVTFAAWLALVTMNVPSLGGGVPSRSPVRVFIYTLIPIWNLFKVPGMMQDALYRLDAQAGGAWMVMGATIGLLGSWFVAWIGGWIIAAAAIGNMAAAPTIDEMVGVFGDVLDQSFWLSVVTELMVTVGILLLVVLMVRIEQRVAARNREINGALDALAAGGVPELADQAGAPAAPVEMTAAAPAPAPIPDPVPSAIAPHGFQVAGRSPSEVESRLAPPSSPASPPQPSGPAAPPPPPPPPPGS